MNDIDTLVNRYLVRRERWGVERQPEMAIHSNIHNIDLILRQITALICIDHHEQRVDSSGQFTIVNFLTQAERVPLLLYMVEYRLFTDFLFSWYRLMKQSRGLECV